MKCDDCKGSGRYISLLSDEPCRKCGGSGKLSSSSDEVLRLLADEQTGISVKMHEPLIGQIVWVYDADWIETCILRIEATQIVLAYTFGRIYIPLNSISWNKTLGRYEYIRSGTPVWP